MGPLAPQPEIDGLKEAPWKRNPSHTAMSAMDSAQIQYFAGLIDAQLSVSISKNATEQKVRMSSTRVTLSCNDPRVAEELAAKFRPTRVTIIKRPDKKDVCTALFTGEQAKVVLEFAAEHCIIKKELAAKALQYMEDETVSAEVVKNVEMTEVEDVSLDWASGFFDVRGIVVPPVAATEDTKKRRGSVKLVLPKTEKYILPALQKVLSGKVKKSSPCRLVYESKDAIKSFVDIVGDHVRAKKEDLEQILA